MNGYKMGCYTFTGNKVVSGLIIPDQELIINQVENDHPFALVDISSLFGYFSSSGLIGSISDSQFFSWCSSLEIPASAFVGKYGVYLDMIRVSSKQIDVHQLLVTSILLSRGHFFNKIKRLLKLYTLSNLHLTQLGLSNMLEDLIHASTVVLPSMSKGLLADEFYNHYMNRVKSAESLFINKFLALFRGAKLISQREFLEVFEKHYELQKVCWANGVRMILIEEDIKSPKRYADDTIEPHSGNSTAIERWIKHKDRTASSVQNTRTDGDIAIEGKNKFSKHACSFCKVFNKNSS